MIKFNKEMHKRPSTYANFISIGIGAFMLNVPSSIPGDTKDWIMCCCGVVVALCQLVTKNDK